MWQELIRRRLTKKPGGAGFARKSVTWFASTAWKVPAIKLKLSSVFERARLAHCHTWRRLVAVLQTLLVKLLVDLVKPDRMTDEWRVFGDC